MSRSKTVWMGAPDAVLDGQHRRLGQPLRERLEGDLELLAGQGLRIRAGLAGGALAVGPGDALVGHAVLGGAGRMDLHACMQASLASSGLQQHIGKARLHPHACTAKPSGGQK